MVGPRTTDGQSSGEHIYVPLRSRKYYQSTKPQTKLSQMNRLGPVVIIEDDADDREILENVFHSLGYKNKLLFFVDGEAVLKYLNASHEKPFLILSDINLPLMDGFELRKKIKQDAALEWKCIPYLFFTTSSNHQSVVEAYSLSVQGFFIKPNNIMELEQLIKIIMEYWKFCASPNNLNPHINF